MTRDGHGKPMWALLLSLVLCLGIGPVLLGDAPPPPTHSTGLETAVDGGVGSGFMHPGDTAVTQRVALTDNDTTDEDNIAILEIVVANLGSALSPDFALIEIIDGGGNVIGQVATPAALPAVIDIDPDFEIADDTAAVLEVRCTVAGGVIGRRTIQTQLTIRHSEGVFGVAVPFVVVVADGNATTINNCPTAVDDNAATTEGAPVWVAVQGNDNDGDADPLTTSWVGTPAKGTATIGPGQAVTYNPNGQFEYLSLGEPENVTFDYRITDGDGSCGPIQATVTVTVNGLNDAPVGNNDAAVTDENTAIDIDVLGNDTEVDHLDVLQVSALNTAGTVGCVNINPNNTIHFDPCGQYEGLKASQQTTFEYTVSDGHGGTDTATVTVEVAGVNDLPVANDDAANTNEDTAVVVNVLGNDTDIDSALTVCQITQPAHGVVVNNVNNVTYTPHPNWFGIDTFTYRACDEVNGDWATVTVNVASVNDIPVANDDAVTVNEDSSNNVIDVLANDTDADPADVLFVDAIVTLPGHGGVVNNGNSVSYTPNPNWFGNDWFEYRVADGNGGTDIARVDIAVLQIAALFYDNMENGTNGWKGSSWYLLQDSCCPNMPSPTHDWSFGKNSAVKFPRTGKLTSPVINVTGETNVEVSFWYALKRDTAQTYVRAKLEYLAGRKWLTLWTLPADPTGVWTLVGPLGVTIPAKIAKLQLRFTVTGTSGKGCFTVDNVRVTSGAGARAEDLAVVEETSPAEEFVVESVENVPNPIRDVHTTRFTVKGVGIEEICVNIYDQVGTLVFTSGWQANGYDWHVESSDGETLANGVYLYVVAVRGENGEVQVTEVKKLVIFR